MDISDIPPEVLSLTLGQLFEYQCEDDPESPIHYGHLRNARLVCRQWNKLATAHLFRTLTLDAEPENGMWSWKHMPWSHIVNSETIQRVAQNIVICSHPEDLEEDDDASDVEGGATEDDDDDDSGRFGVAVNGIAKLPNLKSLQICFAEKCQGARDTSEWWEDDEETESISHRLQTLKTVFGAIRKRRAAVDKDNRTSIIRSLTLKNLQNIPIPEFTSSDLYKDVMKDINELHLMIAHDYNEHGPDQDLDRIERQTYEPYLQKELLPPLAHQLRSLTLTFRECWGVIPAYFDGKGLVFPNLRTLTLGEFVIGHHDQFDWVLAQKSLKTLRLDRCFIVSYLRVMNEQWDEWRVPTHDWHEYPEGSFGFTEGDHTLGFSGTWETVYDRIREGLPKLREFCSVHHEHHNTFDRRESMGASLSKLRYLTFDSGSCPSPWIEAEDNSGTMLFGNNDPAVCPRDATESERYVARKSLNRAEETELGDTRAFEDLLWAVRGRG
ncbi:hypothetical protein C8A00DRAFT_46335 [Chaetomidium leptoderma]|uniref:F-box domain-containing protein n=1 Tax=Chaetomidium leptoderma TaxID=669021 RepID=A0AAN6ZSH8_9PEZI|nr:hypothetical protein C8A00DRAFT_46335 [Chaetomidium leptoderma]